MSTSAGEDAKLGEDGLNRPRQPSNTKKHTAKGLYESYSADLDNKTKMALRQDGWIEHPRPRRNLQSFGRRRPHGISTSWPRRPPLQKTSTEYHLAGMSTRGRVQMAGRLDPRNIHVAPAAGPRFASRRWHRYQKPCRGRDVSARTVHVSTRPPRYQILDLVLDLSTNYGPKRNRGRCKGG